MKTIILSAGHGGSDPGAVGNGVRESDANLAITLFCRDALNQFYSGHRLILPRETDKFVSLPFRRDLAAREKADLYVSMHNNSFNNPSARGFETFISSGEVYEITRQAQRSIHNAVYSELKKHSVPDRGMKRHPHWVTTNIKCPVVLVEYLFVSSPLDAALLKQQAVLKALGEATAKGIAEAMQLPLKQTQDSWPTFPIPRVTRTIGVETNGQRTDEVAYLINNATYVRAKYLEDLTGIVVSGHGDHIKIKKGGS
jgi:N-acetylmuramoyl-L-alanine amidase